MGCSIDVVKTDIAVGNPLLSKCKDTNNLPNYKKLQTFFRRLTQNFFNFPAPDKKLPLLTATYRFR